MCMSASERTQESISISILFIPAATELGSHKTRLKLHGFGAWLHGKDLELGWVWEARPWP